MMKLSAAADTIPSHIAEGDTVEVIFLTSGEKSGHGMSEEKTIQIREKESEKPRLFWGYKIFRFGGSLMEISLPPQIM